MSRNRQLMFVDDEPNILSALKRVFFDDAFTINSFTKGEEAIEFLRENEVEVIISDQRMPGMTGTEVLARAREVRPEAMRIILTGFADMEAAVEAINMGQIYQFIFKPWNDEELRSVVMRALDHYDLALENARLTGELMVKNQELETLNAELGKKVKERTALIVQKNLELGKLNKSLEGSLLNTVRVFMNVVQQTSPRISSHSRRVTGMSVDIARELGWTENRIRDLEIAGLLHDIGKLGIPEKVLAKPREQLADAELEMLNNHTILGQNTLGAIEAFDNVGRIIRAHHERWDGTGFPDGLHSDEIPIEARLLSVCNVYDHLLHDEEGRSMTFVIKFFKNNAGVLFDPEIAEHVLKTFRKQESEEVVERRVQVMARELQPGMVLAENLLTGKGIFLLPEGQVLKETHIRSIQDIQKVDPITHMITVILP